MKKLHLLSATVLLFFVAALLGCFRSEDIRIEVTDTDDEHSFFAKFNKRRARDVHDYINSQVASSGVVTDDTIDMTATLVDGTDFELEKSGGKVLIKLDKRSNSDASYRRIKKMCEGLKKVIGSN